MADKNLKECASNLEDNYLDLVGYAYTFDLWLKDFSSSHIDIGIQRDSALDFISFFLLQKIDDLKFDISILVEYVMKSS